MKNEYINAVIELKKIIQSTNLLYNYRLHISFLKIIKDRMEKNLKEHTFSGMVVENGMDYSYFHFSSKQLKLKGLKFVFVFDYNSLDYQIWLSGMNRKIQEKYTAIFKEKKVRLTLTSNPLKTDYILKQVIDLKYTEDEKVLSNILNKYWILFQKRVLI
ncbi:MAG TPA: hypothetical protein PLL26_01360 [Candidatus Dojkabacteria bacterium]|nr:hypothetical protein [Candidatus Dojkabacteria bacterium]